MFQKRISLFFCVFILWQVSLAQNYEQLVEQATQFQLTNIDSCIHYYHLAEEEAEAEGDSLKMRKIYDALFGIYTIEDRNDLKVEYAQKALEVSQTKLEKGESLIWLAMSYETYDLYKSDSLFQIAEVLLEETEDKSIRFSLFSSYASIKHFRGDYYGAIDYFLKSDAYAQNDFPRAINFTKVSQIFLNLENFDRANEYIDKAIQLTEKHNYNTTRFGFVGSVKARILIAQDQFVEARKELENVLSFDKNQKKWKIIGGAQYLLTKIALKENDIDAAYASNQKTLAIIDKIPISYRITCWLNQAKINFRKQQYSQVISGCKRIINIAETRGFDAIQANHLLSMAYEAQNQQDLAFYYFKQYKTLNDSLYQSEQTSLLTSLEAKYNRKEQENTIALLDAENEVQAVQLSQQNKIIIIGGVALVIISGLLFFLFRSNKKVRSQNKIISETLSEKQTLLTEKETLLKEIHHRVKNNLQLVSSLLGFQSQNIKDPSALQAINSGKARVKSMALIHQDLYNQENLKGINFKDYFQKLCQELIATYRIDSNQIKLITDIDDIELDIDTIVPLGLIVNELLTNALKYAFPNGESGEILIKLYLRNQKLMLEVKDTGIGMDTTNKEQSSFGMKLVNTLLYQLDGTMHQESGDGTHLVLVFENYKIAA